MSKKWLQELKVGDQVIEVYSDFKKISKVTAVTDTEIVCGLRKYQKFNGYERASVITKIIEATPERLKKYDLETKYWAIKEKIGDGGLHFTKLDENQLQRIYDIVMED